MLYIRQSVTTKPAWNLHMHRMQKSGWKIEMIEGLSFTDPSKVPKLTFSSFYYDLDETFLKFQSSLQKPPQEVKDTTRKRPDKSLAEKMEKATRKDE